MFAQSTLNRTLLVAAATASVCCGNLVMAEPSHASGFTGYYDPSNWTLETSGSTTNVDDSVSGQITISTRPSPINTFRNVDYTIRTEKAGTVSFNWNYSFPSVPATNGSFFRVITDGDAETLIPLADLNTATFGMYTFNVDAGQKIGFRLRNSVTNSGSTDAIATISNFSAPVIPTPAMLPGLVGMWIAAMRKKRQQEVAKEEA